MYIYTYIDTYRCQYNVSLCLTTRGHFDMTTKLSQNAGSEAIASPIWVYLSVGLPSGKPWENHKKIVIYMEIFHV
jgi:hypothetical protein